MRTLRSTLGMRGSKSNMIRKSIKVVSGLINRPYVKGLPVTMTVLSSTEEGDHSEQIVRPTYQDAYTLEYKAWYDTLQNNQVPKTSASDGESPIV